MRQPRVLAVALLLACGLTASGCSTFDPTEWFNQKKPLPGDRKAVFPQGVPGVAQGVPPELVQGYTPPVEPVPEPKVVEEKPKPKPRVAARPKPAPAPRPAQAAAPRPAAPAPQQGAQAPWPDAPPQRAAPQQGAQAPWPDAQPRSAAPPAQSVFPDPPPPAR